MAAKTPKTTKITNRTLKTAKRALDSWVDKHNNGEFILEKSVLESFATASGVISCEMSRQHPVRKRKSTLKVEIVNGDEAQEFRRSQLAQQKQANYGEG
tara:strand:- start:427 stop:723 length:297 start_codon:yes stop_codon:yes gene_type:complete